MTLEDKLTPDNDFKPLEDYFQRINAWKGLTDEEVQDLLINGIPFRLLEKIERILKERNKR